MLAPKMSGDSCDAVTENRLQNYIQPSRALMPLPSHWFTNTLQCCVGIGSIRADIRGLCVLIMRPAWIRWVQEGTPTVECESSRCTGGWAFGVAVGLLQVAVLQSPLCHEETPGERG